MNHPINYDALLPRIRWRTPQFIIGLLGAVTVTIFVFPFCFLYEIWEEHTIRKRIVVKEAFLRAVYINGRYTIVIAAFLIIAYAAWRFLQ